MRVFVVWFRKPVYARKPDGEQLLHPVYLTAPDEVEARKIARAITGPLWDIHRVEAIDGRTS